ncbi:PhnD/SsuA/transferrin family substrate-binding protein [Dichotomicrobium thermohalophilum]|uniref:Phosphonate transport system substrate-binding protein n=1 Tax=Dichotomicrobium thermohalophilum TaxID=933063 RepID=A0A397Q2V4_9HYPH|nr:PhnD/SsuA/transferrin family substrate-binding protein [Dichotomicrobium thermohalophilum]RIA55696.1 phosphonate transport system substrate-binding protein [Dichotomicrobium thermohalophilum]
MNTGMGAASGGQEPSFNRSLLTRRALLRAAGGGVVCVLGGTARARAEAAEEVTLGLTPVFLTNDLELLSTLRDYLTTALGQPVKPVLRRTYEEITTLLVSGQLDAAWICGYPYVAFRDQLGLVAAPVWRGKPLYQSYIIARADDPAGSIEELRGRVHAFSDPNSNSGYLVTTALLAKAGKRPERFFSRVFFTYAHRNVVRAVASGLAESGSVDGYVWEVMSKTEPELTRRTRVIRKSEWLGFPPVAAPVEAISAPRTKALQDAFTRMHDTPKGGKVLSLLRLDGFRRVPPSLYDPIAAKAKLVQRFG